jgi:hypothetical protein
VANKKPSFLLLKKKVPKVATLFFENFHGIFKEKRTGAKAYHKRKMKGISEGL